MNDTDTSNGPTLRQRLVELEDLHKGGLITRDEYESSRKRLLESFTSPQEVPKTATVIPPPVTGVPVTNNLVSEKSASRPRVVKCRRGHRMSYISCSDQPKVSTMCPFCRESAKIGQQYYVCEECQPYENINNVVWRVTVCKACVEKGHHLHAAKMARWHTEVLDCWMEPRSCMESLLCTYCFQDFMAKKAWSDAKKMNEVTACSAICSGTCWCMLELMMAFLTNHLSIYARRSLVNYHGIQEDTCQSCMIAYFCRCCSDCQVHREMTIRGHCPGSLLGLKQPNEDLLRRVRVPVRVEMGK